METNGTEEGTLFHQRLPVEEANDEKFGRCTQHKNKKNEFYDRKKNKAFCTTCAIDLAQGREDVNKKLVSLDSAYRVAKENAKNQDADLDLRQSKIEKYLQSIAAQEKVIKQQAANVRNTIAQMVEKSLKDLSQVVQDKVNVLKSDKVEL